MKKFISSADGARHNAELCAPVAQDKLTASCQSRSFLASEEEILFALVSPRDEFAFTNQALILVESGAAATSSLTKKSVKKLEYGTNPITNLRFEASGANDKDCELRFTMGLFELCISIAKSHEDHGQKYFRVLDAVAHEQANNARRWEFARLSLDKASGASDPKTGGVANQAREAFAFLDEMYTKYNPRCYRHVIVAILEHPEEAKPAT